MLRSIRVSMFAVVAFAALTAAQPARSELVLNEVLYDPAGADEGQEFVELWNPDSTARSLDGVSIEAGDGARPDTWTSVWRAPAGLVVAPGSAFLVDGEALTGSLQNGPDAVRLIRGATVLDLLGYGDLASPLSYEGAPAPDVASGSSLARVTDGVDTNVNRDDWAAEGEPTPGVANHPATRLRIARTGVRASPEVAWPGEPIEIAAWIRNTGRSAIEGSHWKLVAEESAVAGAVDTSPTWLPVGATPGVAIAPSESLHCAVTIAAPGAGLWRVRLRLQAASASAAGSSSSDRATESGGLSDTSVVAFRSLAGPAVLSEIAFHDAGAGEWIEVWFRESVPDIGALAIADAVSAPRLVERGPVTRRAEAGSYLVIAQGPERVRARFALADTVVLGVVGGWPALNDEGTGGEPADHVRILIDGAPSDAAPYWGEASERGGSLERLSPDLPSAAAGTWLETIDRSGGTPGRANSMHAPGADVAARGPLLVAGARVLRRDSNDAPPIVFRATPEAKGRRLTVRVQDLLGRPIRTLVEGQRFVAPGAFLWDGKDDHGAPVPPGLYVVRAEALAENGAPARSSALPLAVAAGGAP